MESKLNNEVINEYSKDYSNAICNSFFSIGKKIIGKEILSFTPSRQINLFILKNLFTIWDKESEKFKSKFFDYENNEVKEALATFLNTLSQNISIEKTDFFPLLEKAVYECLLIVLSPYDFYVQEIQKEGQRISVNHLKKISKYILINKHLIEDLIKKLEEKGFSDLDVNRCLIFFNEVCEESSSSPEDIDEHLRTFNNTKPLNINDFYHKDEPEVSRANENLSNAESKKILAESFTIDVPTLNEKFTSESAPSLAEKLQKSKIQSIKSSIPINQKFIYINELFKGNIQDFAMTVDEIDECHTLSDAKNLIQTKFIPRYNWSVNNETLRDFIETVERKFI